MWSIRTPRKTFGQDYGYILYRTKVTGPVAGRVVVDDLGDFAAVYLDHRLVGTLDRRLKQTHLDISAPEGPVTLDILVENTGRINYGPRLQDGQAGISWSVSLVGHELSGWQVYPLPMTGPEGLQGWETKAIPGPAFHRGMFSLASVADTYLDVSKLGKGFVWINGHNVGRSWSIGPQQSLFSSGTLVAEGLESGGGL